jgi:hypothetical protein
MADPKSLPYHQSVLYCDTYSNMFKAAPSNKFEYETGFFFGSAPGATGTEAGEEGAIFLGEETQRRLRGD